MAKGSVHQKYIAILNMCATNISVVTYGKQNLIELQ